MKSRPIVVTLFVLISIVVSACTFSPNQPDSGPVATNTANTAGAVQEPQSGGTLRYGLTLPVSGIDPHVHANSELGIALNSVYDTLVAQDLDGSFHPYLAESWDVSDDGTVYTFSLRRDVTFHDGSLFNAAAVVRNFDRIADPATLSQKAIFLLGPYDHAEAVDEYTVRIVLSEPYAALLDGLSQVYLGMASPAALDQWGDNYQLHQVGTGPFRFVAYQERQSLVLERNPDYTWAPEIREHDGPAYLDRVEFRFYADPATRLPALLSGQADVMGELLPQDVARIEASQDFALYPIAVPGQSVQFFLNTELAPMDDLRVRQALLFGTDRSALVNAVFGPTSQVAQGTLAAVTRGAITTADDAYVFDPARSQSLLEEAGWTDTDGDGLRERGGEPLALRGILMSWGELAKIGTVLQAQWRALGVDLQLEQMAYPAALEAGRQGTHHLIPFVFAGTDPNLLYGFFHSSGVGGFNWSRVSDPEVDAWLEEAATVEDWPRRAELYALVQERVMDQAWIVPIRDPVNLNAASVQVQELAYDVQGWYPVLYDVWLERSS